MDSLTEKEKAKAAQAEYTKAYYHKNYTSPEAKALIAERKKIWYQNNKEKVKQYQEKYWAKKFKENKVEGDIKDDKY
jgi:hypothetical protein